MSQKQDYTSENQQATSMMLKSIVQSHYTKLISDPDCFLNHLKDSVEKLLETSFNQFPYKYVAFHYRASYLAEGRNSPAIWPNVGEDLAETKPYLYTESIEKWVKTFLPSLLKSYLYVFGRDVSLSEAWILRREDDREKATADSDIDSAYLQIDDGRNGHKKELPTTGNNSPFLYIPKEYFEYITCYNKLPKILIEGVIKTLTEKNSRNGDKWEELDGIGDYRKVECNLTKTDGDNFYTLCNRGIEVALYHYYNFDEGKGNASEIDKSINEFLEKIYIKKQDPPSKEDIVRHFFRVIQGASMFTQLLGNNITITSFPCYIPADIASRKHNVDDLNTINNFDGLNIAINANWKYKDFHSAITVYSETNPDSYSNIAATALRYLTLATSPPRATIGNFVKEDFHSLESKFGLKSGYIFNFLEHNRYKEKYYWPLLGLIVSESMRGLVHEGKRTALNIAIGSDVEFREMLTPIYKVNIDGYKNVFELRNILKDPVSLATFQKIMRAFVRRHFSFIQGQTRFICIHIEQGTVEICYLADLRNEYRANTATKMLKKIVNLSKATVARIDAGGRASVISYIEDKDKRVFSCDLQGHWVSDLIEDTEGTNNSQYIDVEKLQNEFDNFVKPGEILNKNEKDFIHNRLIPIIEDISEDPSVGGTIVLIKNVDGKIENHEGLFWMPNYKMQVKFDPEESITYIAKETLKQFIVQDGATVINVNTGILYSRVQLVGYQKNQSDASYDSWKNHDLPEKLAHWGTRHISALRFVESVFEGEKDNIVAKQCQVFCIVISQDGEVHLFRSDVADKSDMIKQVIVY